MLDALGLLRVGVVGVGEIGGGIAERLLACGFPTSVFDLRPERVVPLEAAGARVAADLGDIAATSDVVLIVVFDDEQVRRVVAPLLESAGRGCVLVVQSTVLPATILELEEVARARGVGLVDCALNGGRPGAVRGRLTLYIGGEEEPVRTCWPVFESIGTKLLHAGGPSTGVTAKLVNDLVAVGGYALHLEAMALGGAFGLDEATVTRICSLGTGDSRGLRTWGRMDGARRARRAAGRDATDTTRKALSEALSAATSRGVALPVTATASATIEAKLTRRDRDLDARYGTNRLPSQPTCDICGFELAAPFQGAGVHPECGPGR